MRNHKIGELIIIDNKEFIINKKKCSNGRDYFYRADLILLNNLIKNNQRKNKTMSRGFKGITFKRIEKEGLKEK